MMASPSVRAVGAQSLSDTRGRHERLALTDSAPRTEHVQSLDGLRGLAAVPVMIGHAAYFYFDRTNPSGQMQRQLWRRSAALTASS
jgi:hypothetical protein